MSYTYSLWLLWLHDRNNPRDIVHAAANPLSSVIIDGIDGIIRVRILITEHLRGRNRRNWYRAFLCNPRLYGLWLSFLVYLSAWVNPGFFSRGIRIKRVQSQFHALYLKTIVGALFTFVSISVWFLFLFYRKTRFPKAIYDHRYPCPAFDFFVFDFFVCDFLCEQGSGPGGDRRENPIW